MKTWKKIITLTILMFVSMCSFFACGKGDNIYADMYIDIVSAKDYNGDSIENNTITFFKDNTKNRFTLVLDIFEAPKDTSDEILCSIDDTSKVCEYKDSEYKSRTTFYFEAKSGGNTFIRFRSAEGGATLVYEVKVIVPISNLSINSSLIPLVRGEAADLSEGENYLTYTPSNTSQRGIKYEAFPIEENPSSSVLEEIEAINKYIADNNHSSIKVPSSISGRVSTIKSFAVKITSQFDETISRTAIVNVLEKINKDNFTLLENIDTSLEEVYPLLSYDDQLDKFSLTLASNQKDHFNYRQAMLQVMYVVDKYAGDKCPLNEYLTTYKRYNPLNISEIIDVELPEYSVTLKNLGPDGKFTDTTLVSAASIGNSQFQFTQERMEEKYTATFVIDYNGFEGMYESVEIPLEIQVKTFPSEIRLYESKKDMEIARQSNGLGAKDNDIVLYSNGVPTPVYVDVWGDANSISDVGIGHIVNLQVSNQNIEILDMNDNPITSCLGGTPIYLKKVIGAEEIKEEVTLTVTSSVYSRITTTVKLQIVNDATTITVTDTVIALEYQTYDKDPTTINNEGLLLVTEGYWLFSGLPLDEEGMIDYSTLTVDVEDSSLVEYLLLGGEPAFVVYNKMGKTNVTIRTQNDVEYSYTLTVYYPIENVEFFKIQIEDFEERGDEHFAYTFSGSESNTDIHHTKLLVGNTYNLYYFLGNSNNVNEMQRYDDLTGIMNIHAMESENSKKVSVSGSLITLSPTFTGTCKLSFVYSTMVGAKKIYFNIIVHAEVPVSKIQAKFANPVDIYDKSTIDTAAVNPVSGKLYLDEYGKELIILDVNPTNPTTNYAIEWLAAIYNPITKTTQYLTADYKETIDPDTKERICKYIFTGPSRDPNYSSLIVELIVNEYKGKLNGESVTMAVTGLASDSLGFYLYPVVLQEYVNQFGEVVQNSKANFDKSYIHAEIYVEAYKNIRVGDIKVFNAYNNTVDFDIRESENTIELDYALIEKTSSGKKMLVKEITIKNYGAPDLEVVELANNKLKITLKNISGEYIENPVYKIELLANDNSSGKVKTTITVKVATGTIENPFQVGSIEDLQDIANTAKFKDALDSHYVLIKNIDLRTINNWKPLGNKEKPFNGSLSGRYYLNESKTEYRDYAIMNLNIRVDNTSIAQEATIRENNYGLFGCIGTTGIIRNLSIYNYSINIKSYDNSNAGSLTENIGVIAAINNGKIINCLVNDGVVAKFNGATINGSSDSISGIYYDAGNSQISTVANIGAIVGYNTNEITNSKVRGIINISNYDSNNAKNVRVGGVSGVNMPTGIIRGGESNFLVSNGIDEFDVAVIINSHQKKSQLSCFSDYGGVVGVNVGTVRDMFVRSFIYNEYYNAVSTGYGLGGLVGDNRGVVSNNVVVPTLIGQGNVGGLIGLATNEEISLSEENFEGNLQIEGNKVQFIDFSDEYIYINTSIYASGNVGGLVGFYFNRDVNVNTTGDSISSITLNNVINGNSVTSYFSKEMSYSSYDRSEIKDVDYYYGDIVVNSNDDENYISGFIGNAQNAIILSGYVNANISFKANNNSYIGGFVGKGNGILSIFNGQVLGKVINNSPSYSAEEFVGNFIGDASEINTYYENKELKFVISPKTGRNDGSEVNANVFDIIEFSSLTASAESYKNSLRDLKDLATTLAIYNINFVCNETTNNYSYEYGNIVSSYSLLTLRDYTSTNYVSVDNFVGKGETRKYDNGSYQMGVKYNGNCYNVDYVEIPNLLVYNSFYVGLNVDFKLNIDNLTDDISSQVDLNISKVITLDDINKVYFEEVSDEYDYYLSVYNYDCLYTNDDNDLIRTYVYYNIPLVVGSDVFEKTALKLNDSYGANGITKTSNTGNNDISQKLYNIFYSADNSTTGLERQEVYGVESISSGDIDNYYRFYNNQIHSAYPVALANETTYESNGKEYVNLITTIPPTVIEVEVNENNTDFKDVWESVVEGVNSISSGNKTITYYELDYADAKKEPYKFSTMPWKEIDGQKVIDLDLDGTFENIETLYSDYISHYISTKNIYSLDEIIGLEITPQFLKNGMISFNYENPNDADIAKISIIDNKIVLQTLGVGSVTFTVSSAYNTNKADMPKFTINIVSPANKFEILDESNNKLTDISLPLFEKSSPMKSVLSSELTDYNNEYLKSYCHKDLKLTLKSNSSYGVRYFYQSGDQLSFINPTVLPKIKVSGSNFKELVVDGKYYYYVDIDASEFTITGEETVNNIKLFAMPYYNHGVDRTYLSSFDDISKGVGQTIEISIVRGVTGVYVDLSDDIKITPPTEIPFDVLIETDDEDSILMLEAKDKDGNYIAINSTDTKVDLTHENIYFINHLALELENIEFSANDKIKRYTFSIDVAEKYLFDRFIGDYTLIFSAIKNTYTPDVIFSDEVGVNVYATPIQDVFLDHYTTVDQFSNESNVYEFKDYYSSNTLVSGYPGLLRINLYPSYANIDYVEVVSSSVNGTYVALEQLVAVYDSTNSYFNGYYVVYDDERTLIENSIGKGIRLGKISKVYNAVEYDYNGILYLRTFVPDMPIGSSEFTLTVTCYLSDGSSYNIVYPSTSTDKNTINIQVTRIPTIDISIDGGSSGVVAFGDNIEIDVDLNEDLDIDWIVTGKSGLTTTLLPVYNKITKKYELGVNSIQTLMNTFSDYKQLIGEELTIKAEVSYVTKGRVYSTSDTIKVKLALLTIDEIGVKYVENGKFVGVYNQTYELQVNITKFSYDTTYFTGDNNLIFKLVEQFENKLSNYMSNTFFYKNGNYWTPFTLGQLTDFYVDLFGDNYTITNNMRYPSTVVRAKGVFEYVDYQSSANTYGIIINPKSYSSDYAIEKICEFGLEFIRLSNEENPEPIYTQQELKNMEAGGYYILLGDITLENWTPIETPIASLDGNGYVITIENKIVESDGVQKQVNSFYDTSIEANIGEDGKEEKQDSLSLGIFSTISETTTIKNLIIEVKGKVEIDVAHYETVEYGTLAAVNEGFITNVVMTNNANKYRNERNSLLLSKGLIDKYQQLDEGYNTIDELSLINLDYGTFDAESTSNRIGTMVAINNGYITNSNVNNISISGLDCVAGFVADNQKTISSSYYAGGNVTAQVSPDSSNVDGLGSAGFVFYNSGLIAYSYAAGNRFVDGNGNEISSTGINLTAFNGRDYKGALRLRSTGVITEGGNSSGFVFDNGGRIIDSYSNILVSGRKSAGFVYTNSGTINNVYTMSSVLHSEANANPFIGVNDTKTQSNNFNTSKDAITNAYYLKLISSDKFVGSVDEYKNERLQDAVAVSKDKLSSYSTFETFAFNSNYDSVGDIDYGDDKLTAIEEIVRSVWFYPSNITANSSYFRESSYISGAPQLVSANLNNYSLKYYVSGNSTKIIDTLYNELKSNYFASSESFSKNSIVNSFSETYINGLINKLPLGATKENIISTIKGYADHISTDSKYDDLVDKYRNADIVDNTLIQYINVDLYLEEREYLAFDETTLNELKSFVAKLILEKEIFSSYCYINVNVINKEVNNIPTQATYSYYQVLENSDNINIEYGSSVLNPYLVKTSSDYNTFVLQTNDNNENTISNKNYILNKYLRFISDISFNENNTLVAETYNVIFKGVVDGNGMTINNLRINADTTKSNNAINNQLSDNYLEPEVYISGQDDLNNPKYKKATSLGLFGKLINGAVVKNLNVNVSELYGTGVNFVGTIAGQVIDSKIYNIDVTGTNVVYGKNIVGGIAGSVTGKSSLVNLNSNISVTATYYGTYNGFDSSNVDEKTLFTTFNSYTPGVYDEGGNYTPSTFVNVSHAGGIAGVISVIKDDVTDNKLDTNTIGQIRHVVTKGSGRVIGEVVGGIAAFVGKDSLITSSKVYVSTGATLDASRVAGGIAGINLGGISRSFVSNDLVTQSAIDDAIGTTFSSPNMLYAEKLTSGTGSETYFSGNPHFIGGITGLNIGGVIGDTYNKVNVTNIDSQYAGGLIGANVGGQIKAVYTTADVYGFFGIGGIVGLNISADSGKDALHLNNLDSLLADDNSKVLNMHGVVAINMWKFEHINPRRSHLGGIYTGSAQIGSLVGSVLGENNGVVVDSNLQRQLSENIFTITTYTYDSIYNGSLNNGASTYKHYELLPEIGGAKEEGLINLYSITQESVLNNYSEDNKYIINNHQVQFGVAGAETMHCGNIIEVTSKTIVDGNPVITIGQNVHYSRFRKYSSSRTLAEIVARVGSKDLEKTVLNQIYGGATNTIDCNKIQESIGVNAVYEMHLQNIYPSNVWTNVVWSGVGVTRINDVHSVYEKSDKYILPVHEKKSNDMIIDVYKYEDLLQANDYPNATFRLRSNITVPAGATPILSLGNPFTGSLISDTSGGTNYEISFANGMNSSGVAGLFAAIKGAEISNVNFSVGRTIRVSNSGNNDSAAGVIFGYGYSAGNKANVIKNVNITFENDSSITVDGANFSAAYIGSVGGSVEGVNLSNVTINNSNIIIGTKDSAASTNNILNRSMYIGGIFGYASISANMTYNVGEDYSLSSNIVVNKPNISMNVEFEGGEYNTLAIGGGFGKLVNASNKTSVKLSGVTISSPTIEGKISPKDAEFVNFENISVAGGFGILEGVEPTVEFDVSNIKINSDKGNATLVFENNGVYASSRYVNKGYLSVGGMVGQIGTNGNGYLTLDNFENSMTSVSYIHNNNKTYISDVYKNLHSSVNISAVVGSMISCVGDISHAIGDTDLAWSISEEDRVELNIGSVVGYMNNIEASYLTSYEYLQPMKDGSDNSIPTYLGRNTILNIGGVVGKMTGGNLSNSGYNSNIVLYLADNSYSNVNMGGLVGYAGSEAILTTISQSVTSGKVVLHSADNSQLSSNIGGIIGYVNHSIKVIDSYTSIDLIADMYTTGNENLSAYHTIGGMIGLLEVNELLPLSVEISNSYSIANIIANKSENSTSYIGGIIARAQTFAGSSIEDIIILDSAYYLANFMIDTNSIGHGLSVEDMLYRENITTTGDFDSFNKVTVWEFTANCYPLLRWIEGNSNRYERLRDPSLKPVVINNLTASDLSSNSSVIFVGSLSSTIEENLNIVECDVYFKNPIDVSKTIFANVDKYSRIYGLDLNTLSTHIIGTNNGKISGTRIDGLTSTTGYINVNNGIDINPEIVINSGAIYGTNNGNTIYANFTFAGVGSISENSGAGELELAVITALNVSVIPNMKVINSYIQNGNEYIYYNKFGSEQNLNSSEAKDVLNFADGYDFYNDFIILPYDETLHSDDSNRHEGRVFLRWELKIGIEENWYFDDISLFSTSQTEYAEYSWANYVNKNIDKISSNDIVITSNDISIKSELGLAYYSRLINSNDYAEYVNKNVYISSDLDLFGRLFTPIGSSYLMENNNNLFTGSLRGGNHAIDNLFVIVEKNGGLFGSSAGTKFEKLTLNNSTIIVNSGAVGNLVANQIASATCQNVNVLNSVILHSMMEGDNSSIGGIIGLSENSEITIEKCIVEGSSGNLNNANIVGGFVGEITNGALTVNGSHNTQKLEGKNYVGGIVGYAKDTAITLYQSYNEGDISQTSTLDTTFAGGGLVGYVENNQKDIKISESYSSSSVNGYNAGGLVGLSNARTILTNVYVSRGDIDGDIVTRENANVNVILGNDSTRSAAFVNVTNPSISVSVSQSYSSLLDVKLTNSTNLNTNLTYRIAEDISEDHGNDILTITHELLSMPNNDIFGNWSYIWSRVSQKNNNYPVLLFTNGSWIGVEPQNDGRTYLIRSVEEMAWIAEQVNTGKDTFAGKTVNFETSTLDLQKKLWNPIGHSELRSFQGNVNFNDLTIKNLTTNGYYKDNLYLEGNLVKDYVGLFGYTKNATFTGNLTLVADESTDNEGSHVKGLGNYVGGFIGYAKNTTISESSIITNKLNVEGVGSYVGGIIGAYELEDVVSTYSRYGTEYTLGSLMNYGNVSGLENGGSSNVAGVIGIIKCNDIDKIHIVASNMYNGGDVNHVVGDSGGVVARVMGSNVTFEVTDTIVNSSSLYTTASNAGGIIGYSNGNLIINNAVISNDNEYAVIIRSDNSKSNIGTIVGSANNVTINNVTLDDEGINIISKNEIALVGNEVSAGAVGGLVGVSNNMTINISDSFSVNNISFTFLGITNYIGGIVGRVNDLFTLSNIAEDEVLLSCNNIQGIQGVGYMGGIAGYVENIDIDEDIATSINGVEIIDISDIDISEYTDDIYGYVGGGYGYIKYSTDEVLDLSHYFISNIDIACNTKYLGGIVGKLGVTITFTCTENVLVGSKIKGGIEGNSSNIGGFIGYAGNATAEKTENIIKEVAINNSDIYGYSYVGGFVGQAYNTLITESETTYTNIGADVLDESIKNSDSIGGLVGYGEKVYVFDVDFAGTLKGGNLVGGIFGYGKEIVIEDTTIDITDLYITSGVSSLGRRYAGGAIGYGENVLVENIDAVVSCPKGVVVDFGGIAGYLNNCNIYEVSTVVGQKEEGNVADIYGIVNTITNCIEGANWYTENYWFFDNSNNMFVNDISTSLTMAYAKNVDSPKSINGTYGETIVYSRPAEVEINLANGNIAVNDDFKGMTSEELKSAVYQIYMESGLWHIIVDEVSGDKFIVFSSDMDLRSVNNFDNTPYTLENEKYIEMYASINKRYSPIAKAKDITIYVSEDISDVKSKGFEEYSSYIMPLGTKFFPINNLTICSVWGDDEDKLARVLTLGSDTFIPGSSTVADYNIYGLFGYVEGVLTVKDISLVGANSKDVDIIHNASGDNKVHGTLLALGVAKSYADVSNKIYYKNYSLVNVTMDVSIEESDATVIGNVIGLIENPVKKEVAGDKIKVTSNVINKNGSYFVVSDVNYAYNFSGVVNKGNIETGSVVDSLVVGGIIGKVENLNPTGNTIYTINVSPAIMSETVVYNNTGLRNDGLILGLEVYYQNIYGGIFGSISNSVVINSSSSMSGIIQNTATIMSMNMDEDGVIVGGVIGCIDLDESKYIFDNNRSQLLTTNTYSNMLNGESVYSGGIYYTMDEYKDIEPIQRTSSLVTTGVGGGVIGYIRGNINKEHPSNVKLQNVHNFMNISGVDANNQNPKLGGILGSYSNHLQSLEFNSTINRGSITNDGNVAGGIVSEIKREVENANEYPYLTTVKFINCLNSVPNSVGADNVEYAGGLVGYISDISDSNYEEGQRHPIEVTIDNSRSEGSITSNKYAGGLVGYINLSDDSKFILSSTRSAAWITSSAYSMSDMSTSIVSGEYVGGVVGYISASKNTLFGHINNSWFNGMSDLSGDKSCLDIMKDSSLNSSLYLGNISSLAQNRYMTGYNTLQGSVSVGGIIGHYKQIDNDTLENNLILTNLQNVSKVTSENTLSGGLGGLIGSIENVDNLCVDDSVIDCKIMGANANCVGGVIGQIDTSNNINTLKYFEINNTSVTANSSFSSRKVIGGFVGKIVDDESKKITMLITGSTVRGSLYSDMSEEIGGFVGISDIALMQIGLEKNNVQNRVYASIGNGFYVGGFIGSDYSDTLNIVNGQSYADVAGYMGVGGLVGQLNSGVANIYAYNLSGNYSGYFGSVLKSLILEGSGAQGVCVTGGIIGSAQVDGELNIKDIKVGSSYSWITLTGLYSGGIIGSLSGGGEANIENSVVDSVLVNANLYAGGVIGHSSIASLNIYETIVGNEHSLDNNIIMGESAGGLIGLIYGAISIEASGVYGVNLIATDYAGGLIGQGFGYTDNIKDNVVDSVLFTPNSQKMASYTKWNMDGDKFLITLETNRYNVYRCTTNDTTNTEGATLVEEGIDPYYTYKINTSNIYTNVFSGGFNFAIGNMSGSFGTSIILRSNKYRGEEDIETNSLIALSELVAPVELPDYDNKDNWIVRSTTSRVHTKYIGLNDPIPDYSMGTSEEYPDQSQIDGFSPIGILAKTPILKIVDGNAVIDLSKNIEFKNYYN